MPPHVFDGLAYLVEHRERAVGRDELVAAVWGRTEVSDTLIGQTVMRIRRELGDDGKEQRIVRTIPRFGFRWIAETTVLGDPVGAPAGAAADADLPIEAEAPSVHQAAEDVVADATSAFAWPSTTAPRRVILVALAVILLGTSIGLAVYLRGAHGPPIVATPVPPGQAMAVVVAGLEQGMPAEWNWLRFGVMDVVANRLRSSGLPTVPSENMIALLGSAPGSTPEQLRESGEFGLLVTPRVTRAGSGWQVRLYADNGAGLKATVQAQAGDATEAARLATDRLLVALGREAPVGEGEVRPNAELVERIDAAVLADDPALARALVDQATPAQRDSPEVGLRLAKLDFRLGNGRGARERLLGLLERAPAQTEPVLRAGVLNGLGAVATATTRWSRRARCPPRPSSCCSIATNRRSLAGRIFAAAEGRGSTAAGRRVVGGSRLAMLNDTLALLRVSANEGFLDAELGRPSKALPQLLEAGKGFEQWGAINEAIFVLIGEIDTHLDLLQAGQAMADSADAAQQLSDRVDSRTTLDALALARSRALAAVGRLQAARELLDRLLLTTPPPDALAASAATLQLARIELDEGHPGRAQAACRVHSRGAEEARARAPAGGRRLDRRERDVAVGRPDWRGHRPGCVRTMGRCVHGPARAAAHPVGAGRGDMARRSRRRRSCIHPRARDRRRDGGTGRDRPGGIRLCQRPACRRRPDPCRSGNRPAVALVRQRFRLRRPRGTPLRGARPR